MATGDPDWQRRHARAAVPLAAGATAFTFQLVMMLIGIADGSPPGEIALWLWMLLASAAGATAAGALFRRHFGLPGPAGLGRATLAYLDTIFVGGALGGLLVAPVAGLVIGPYYALAFAWYQPLFLAILLAGLALMHGAGRLRQRIDPSVDPAPPLLRLILWALPFAAFGLMFLAGV